MAGVLSFTLGLETSKFLSGLGMASGQILSLAGAMQALNRVGGGVWDAIERGGALNDLSARTGQSVGSLFQLQEAFKVAGVSGDAVAPMLLRVQKALGGIGDQGEKTDELFARMGLSMGGLKGMNGPQQIEAIAKALEKMPRDQAANVASQIFGREGFGNIMQIAGDMKGFSASLKETVQQAAMVERTAEAFDLIGDTVGKIKTKVGGLFTGIAEGVAPALQALLDFVNGVDWVGIGQNIGTMLNGLAEAFKMGELGGLLMETFRAAFDSLPGLALAGLQKLGVLMIKAFETPLLYLQAGFDYAIEQMMVNPKVRALMAASTGGASEKILQSLGVQTGDARSFQDVFAERKQTGLEFVMPGLGLDEMEENADKNLNEAWEKFKASFSGVADRIMTLGQSTFKTPGKPKKEEEESGLGSGKGGGSDGLSEWEKMGLVIGGGMSGSDYARSTAENTKSMGVTLRNIERKLAPAGVESFARV